jgi:hypothetical protein
MAGDIVFFQGFVFVSRLFVDQKEDPCPGNPPEGWSYADKPVFSRARGSEKPVPGRMMTTGVLFRKIKMSNPSRC